VPVRRLGYPGYAIVSQTNRRIPHHHPESIGPEMGGKLDRFPAATANVSAYFQQMSSPQLFGNVIPPKKVMHGSRRPSCPECESQSWP
jgi:hypothetical protein